MGIEILDGGNGNTTGGSANIDRFQMVGCYLESVNYNTLAYATSDQVTISLTVRYDNAIQFGPGESFDGIGESVTRGISDFTVA